MRESEAYLNFLKRNFLFFVLPVILCLMLAVYFYSAVSSKVRISQTFKLQYNLQNIDTTLALTDQAVAELRAQRFAEVFAGSAVSVYKSSPLNISIESTALSRDVSYNLLIKESEYLRTHFKVEELTRPEITLVEPNLFKYLISGVIVGGVIGLIGALVREYFRNY